MAQVTFFTYIAIIRNYIKLYTSPYYFTCLCLFSFYLFYLTSVSTLNSQLSAITIKKKKKSHLSASLPPVHPKLNVTGPRSCPTPSNQAADPLHRPTPQTHLEVPALTLPSQTPDKELLLLAAGKSLKLSLSIGIVDESESLWVCDINKRNIRYNIRQ